MGHVTSLCLDSVLCQNRNRVRTGVFDRAPCTHCTPRPSHLTGTAADIELKPPNLYSVTSQPVPTPQRKLRLRVQVEQPWMVTTSSAETQRWPTPSPPGVLEGNGRNDHPGSLRTPLGSQSRVSRGLSLPPHCGSFQGLGLGSR